MWYLLLLVAVGCYALPMPIPDYKDCDDRVPKEASSFLIIGDQGSESRSAAQRIANEMNKWAGENGADFILGMGDNFYPDGPASVSDSLWSTRWEDVYTGDNIKDLVWLMSVGNHDYYPYEGYEWNEVLRTWAPGEDRWYLPWLWYNVTFDTPAGKMDLIVTDSQAARKNMNDARTVMYQWYDDTLKWSEENERNKIVVSHHPARTAGGHYPGSGTVGSAIQPQTETYNVDFLLHGHDHNYQHIRYKNPEDGPEILIIGGGGAGLYSEDSDGRGYLDREGFSLEKFERKFSFGGCTITENSITIEIFDEYGTRLDSVSRPARKATK